VSIRERGTKYSPMALCSWLASVNSREFALRLVLALGAFGALGALVALVPLVLLAGRSSALAASSFFLLAWVREAGVVDWAVSAVAAGQSKLRCDNRSCMEPLTGRSGGVASSSGRVEIQRLESARAGAHGSSTSLDRHCRRHAAGAT
jgi:hypothetical protein